MRTLPKLHRRDEAVLSAAAVHPPQQHAAPPAPYLSHRLDRDRPLLFDDIDEAFDGPADMPPGWQPARGADQLNHDAVRDVLADLRDTAHHFRVQDLVPVTRLATVPLPPVDDPLAVLADLIADFDAHDPVPALLGALHGVEAHILRRISNMNADAARTLITSELTEVAAR